MALIWMDPVVHSQLTIFLNAGFIMASKTWLCLARFKHELEALEREVQVYGALRDPKFGLCPKFIGYVYETEKDRVMGFLMEELHGRHPNIGDLGACEDTAEQLHGIGVVHGDLNKYNIIVSGNVAKLIDFEVSTFLEDGHHEEAKKNYGN